ncbi:receptor-type tyrosine-protein phosphatase eta-like isoform X2 [Dysidea avara]|uniref:receptor-type tyrosine-protein phosphatase eta-like isoform X2 n=1 Tax=Dysidea avara TaxID=196820 RepID=UPI00331D22B3
MLYNKMLTVVGLLLLAKCTLQQNFTLSQPATGPSITCQGSNVTLQCVILRNEIPVDIVWRRNGTAVDPNVLTNHQFVFNLTYNANTDLVITNVDLEDDNIEYECTTATNDVTSSIVLNVADSPSLINITVEDTGTTFITISWISTSVGSVTYTILLSSSTGDVMIQIITTDTEYNITGLSIGTSYRISVVPSVGMCQGEGKEVMVNTTGMPTTDIPQLSDPVVVERCVSYLYIIWNDTTQSVPVNYTVMLTNTSSGELLHSTTTNNNYNFTGLTSDTSYTITIAGRNRVGQDVVINHISSLKSEVPQMVLEVTPSSITTSRQQVKNITISWMAPSILNLCTTSLISSYEVQIDYTNNDGHSTYSRSVPSNITSVLMSDLFVGHPLPGTTYNIVVVAVNEGGHGVATCNTPTCDCGSDDYCLTEVVALGIVVTFIITLVVTTLISVIITRMCYKRQLKKIVRTNNNNNSATQDNSRFVLMGRDVKMDTNPSYAIMNKDAIKMDTNPAYAVAK